MAIKKKMSKKKAQTGISFPNQNQINLADQEVFNNFQLENQTAYPITMNGYRENLSYSNNLPNMGIPSPPSRKPAQYNGEVGDAALAGLLGVSALLPNQRDQSPVVRPLNSYNPNPYGNGSRALAQSGATIAMNFKRPQIPLSHQEQQDQSSNMRNNMANDPNVGLIPPQNFLNPQQQFFYNALSNPSTNISDIYRGFNEEISGMGANSSQSVMPGRSPHMGTTMLTNEDKQLLGDEYINYSQKFKGDKVRYFNDLRKRGGSDPRLRNLIDPASVAFNTPYRNGGKISNSGYRSNSPDRWEPQLTIPSNQITMEGVPHPIYGIDDTGYSQIMYPEQNYTFPGVSVTEIPIRRSGGKMKCKNGGRVGYEEGKTYNMSDSQIKQLIELGYELKID